MPEHTLPYPRPVPTVVVSRPGIMQQSLRAWLRACPWVEVIASLGDGLTTLNRLAGLRQGILVIDSNLLEEEVDALLGAVKARQPDIRCLVLVQSSGRYGHLLIQGADEVILRDRSARELQDVLARLAQGLLDPSHD